MTLSEEQAKLQTRLGLPATLLFHPRIQYSQSSGVILLSCKVKMGGTYLGRVFQRPVTGDIYVPVAPNIPSTSSLETPVLADAGVLFAIESHVGEFENLLRIDLRTGQVDAHGRAAFEAGMFFVELASADAAGCVVHGVAGFYPVDGLGRVPYHLVSFVWSSGRTARLAKMEGAFY